jgi:hypothetical protein
VPLETRSSHSLEQSRSSTIVDSDFDIFRHSLLPTSLSSIDSTVCWGAKQCGFGKHIAMRRFGTSSIMFKISVADTPSRRTLIVEGTLIGPWVSELGTTWSNASQELEGRKLVIDLSNVTVISREGEGAIFDLMKKEAKFSCGGVLTRHLLKQLARKKQQESPRR